MLNRTPRNNKVDVINKVVGQAIIQYEELMESDYVSTRIKIDGVSCRGQVSDGKRQVSMEEKNTKEMTCPLTVKVKRGSLIEIESEPNSEDYSMKGLVMSIPTRTPVDFYYSALIFNSVATRTRSSFNYDEYGYVISDSPEIVEEIDLFVQRVGVRERQIDVGIDRDAVNEFVTLKKWDIKNGDIFKLGSFRYKVTDIKELDEEIVRGFMQFYRE